MRHLAIRFAIPGAGPDITFEAGALRAAEAIVMEWRPKFADVGIDLVVDGYAGSSAGSILASLRAFGIGWSSIIDTLVRVFDGGEMIDIGIDGKPGILNWRKIGELCDRVIGPDVRMADARAALVICVADCDTAQPHYLSKRDTPQVILKQAVAPSSSFAPGIITPALPIPSLGTEMSPDIQLKIDGGWADNTCCGVFDEAGPDVRTVALRFESESVRVRQGDLPAIVLSTIRCALAAANRPKTKRTDGLTLTIPRAGDWDFTKDRARVEDEMRAGAAAVDPVMRMWLEKQLAAMTP